MHFIFTMRNTEEKKKREKKRKAHDIPSAFPAFSRFIIAFVHLFRAEGKIDILSSLLVHKMVKLKKDVIKLR